MNRRSKELVTSASENAEQMCPLISDEEHILRSEQQEDVCQIKPSALVVCHCKEIELLMFR